MLSYYAPRLTTTLLFSIRMLQLLMVPMLTTNLATTVLSIKRFCSKIFSAATRRRHPAFKTAIRESSPSPTSLPPSSPPRPTPSKDHLRPTLPPAARSSTTSRTFTCSRTTSNIQLAPSCAATLLPMSSPTSTDATTFLPAASSRHLAAVYQQVRTTAAVWLGKGRNLPEQPADASVRAAEAAGVLQSERRAADQRTAVVHRADEEASARWGI